MKFYFNICPALVISIVLACSPGRAEESVIEINADQSIHPLSHHLTGACIEDVNHEVYGGIYSQMIFGESFQEPAPVPPLKGFAAFGGNWTLAGDSLQVSGND